MCIRDSPKIRGDLGEEALQGILSSSGLKEGENYKVQETADKTRVVINQMINITDAQVNGYHVYQMIRDSGGANDGDLYKIANGNSFTETPSAQLIISKLI